MIFLRECCVQTVFNSALLLLIDEFRIVLFVFIDVVFVFDFLSTVGICACLKSFNIFSVLFSQIEQLCFVLLFSSFLFFFDARFNFRIVFRIVVGANICFCFSNEFIDLCFVGSLHLFCFVHHFLILSNQMCALFFCERFIRF
ncbi:Uncharacterised protein [Chlamydia trachomatis]|nr:Uncharacterised protein [Chlamydia trachomatis]